MFRYTWGERFRYTRVVLRTSLVGLRRLRLPHLSAAHGPIDARGVWCGRGIEGGGSEAEASDTLQRCMQGAALHGRAAFVRAYHWLPEAMKRDCLPSPHRSI